MTGKKTGAPAAAALVRPVATGILIGSAFLLIFISGAQVLRNRPSSGAARTLPPICTAVLAA